MRRTFSPIAAVYVASIASAQSPSGTTDAVVETPGLVAFWTYDEEAGKPRISTGTKSKHPLAEVGGPIACLTGGPISAYAAELNGRQYFTIPYSETGDLNIAGKDAHVSMFKAVRDVALYQSRTNAGMWSECNEILPFDSFGKNGRIAIVSRTARLRLGQRLLP